DITSFFAPVSKEQRREREDEDHEGAEEQDERETEEDYQRAVKTNTTLANILNKEHSKQVKENCEYIKTIGEVILFTARQNLVQRGHDESEESNKKGNFREILETVADHNAAVKHRLTTIHNAKYTSKIIQNEVLDCLAEMVRSEIVDEVKNSEYFSIMADETKDVSKQEQISFVLSSYYNGTIKESFLHFESAERLDAVGLTEKIVHLLEHHGLDYKNNLIGQAYDGAAVMSGKHPGVQARIKEKAKYALYIHCSAHCLNLVLVHVIKAVPEAEEFFRSTRELQQLSDTTWACRFIALWKIMDRLPALKRILQEMVKQRRGEKSSEARGLLVQIDQEFAVYLVTFRKLFGETKLLSDMLQSSTVDLLRAADLVEGLVQTLTYLRQESFFDNYWDEVLNILAKRQRKTSSRLREYHILSSVGQWELDCDKEAYWSSFFHPVIDCMLSVLSRRFLKTNCELMSSIRSLNPKSDAFLKDATLFEFGLYDSNIDDLGHELHQFKRLLERKIKSGVIQKPSDTVELILFTDPYKEVFYKLFRLCKIAVALPVSSTTCEWSCSTLKLVKTYLQSTITDECLSNLGVLSIESRRGKALNLDAFVDCFARNHKRRILNVSVQKVKFV
uniref:DUF4371 domain-containing protein n=1 Tax=Erpetoichthys calabaricus TaxID=27687 RepID=A0A8C4RT82_ERPCA